MVQKSSPETFGGKNRKFDGKNQMASKNVGPEIELMEKEMDWKDKTHVQHHICLNGFEMCCWFFKILNTLVQFLFLEIYVVPVYLK